MGITLCEITIQGAIIFLIAKVPKIIKRTSEFAELKLLNLRKSLNKRRMS